MPGSTMFFSHYLINSTIFGKKLVNPNCVFWFFVQPFPEIFLILRSTGRDRLKMYTGLQVKYPLILSYFLFFKTDFSQQIFEKYSNIKFQEYPSSGRAVVPCGQSPYTDTTSLPAWNFFNTPSM
jgi:hypothetical protein